MSVPPNDEPTKDFVEMLATQFEEAWKKNQRPDLGRYLADYHGDQRGRLVTELVILDAIYRRKAGECFELAEYRWIPELAGLSAAEATSLREAVDRSAPCPAVAVPKRIGKYPILNVLATGGQAVTYRADHPQLQINVVLKLARTDAPSDPAFRDVISREANVLAGLRHDNLVRVYDLDVHEGRVFLVLEHVTGTPLAEHAAVKKPDPLEAARLVLAAAQGLAAAHRHGVHHLDVTPRNVMIDAAGQVRVIDFGLARDRGWRSPSAEFPLGGTPAYLSPEQAGGRLEQVGARTDVFGLGGLLYFLLTGKPLYAEATVGDLFRRAQAREIDLGPLGAKDIPGVLKEICLRSLDREPANRYADAGEMAGALAGFLKNRERVGWLRYLALVAALFLLAVAGGWWLGRERQTRSYSTDPLLSVVGRDEGGGYPPLVRVLPIRQKEPLQVRTHVPKNLHLRVYLVNGKGEIDRLADYPPKEVEREEVFPGPDRTFDLEGPAGTEFVFVCGRAGKPLSDEEVKRLWDAGGQWPALPHETAVAMRVDRVKTETERPRDVGQIREHNDPTERVRQRLEGFRQELRRSGAVVCDGVAFGHP